MLILLRSIGGALNEDVEEEEPNDQPQVVLDAMDQNEPTNTEER